MLGRLIQNLVHTRRPYRDWTNLPLSVCASSVETQVSSGLPQGWGVWVQQTWVWHKPSWRRSPLTPPQSCQNLPRTRETDSYRAQTKPCIHQDPGERSSDPTRDWPRLACECLGVPGGDVGWQWPAAGTENLSVAVHAQDLLKEVTIFFITSIIVLVSGQTEREHSPAQQQKIGLKIYWAWPRPSEQDPVSPTVSLSHQEASISLLSSFLRGQTEWKPQSQKTNQTDHINHSLV